MNTIKRIELNIKPIQKKKETDTEFKIRKKFQNDNLYGILRISHIIANITATTLHTKMYDSKKHRIDMICKTTELNKNLKFFNKAVDGIIHSVFKKYGDEYKAIFSGKKSLMSYKLGFPVPVIKRQLIIGFGVGYTECKTTLGYRFTIYGTDLECYFGRDKSSNRQAIDDCIAGKAEIRDSLIQLKNGKLYLLLTIKTPDKVLSKKTVNTAGIDLGIAKPAVVALKDGSKQLIVGDAFELLKMKQQIQHQKRRLQSSLKTAKGGKGRKKKLQAMDQFRTKESNISDSFNHKYSRAIIDFCIKNKVSTIHLENLSGIDKKSKFLKDWTYFSLQEKITYKAKMEGIAVHKVDPAYTSQTCSKCGNVDKANRVTQSYFHCTSCGLKKNADVNAAINIANKQILTT